MTSEGPVLTPDRVIEVSIGLWDDSAVPRGESPPRLAAAIVAALADAGYVIAPARVSSATDGAT